MFDQELPTDCTEADDQDANALSMDPAVAAAWQYRDEIEYQAQVAISYPQDAKAIFAANWLHGQGAW